MYFKYTNGSLTFYTLPLGYFILSFLFIPLSIHLRNDIDCVGKCPTQSIKDSPLHTRFRELYSIHTEYLSDWTYSNSGTLLMYPRKQHSAAILLLFPVRSSS